MARVTRSHTLRSFASLSHSPHAAPSVEVPLVSTSVQFARRLQIIAFGDSLTQQAAFPHGWYALLASKYRGRADLFNRGYSGYTTRNALTTLRLHIQAGIWPSTPHLSSSSAESRIQRLVLVWLGSNDSCTHFTSMADMNVPLAAFTANMRNIVQTLRSTPPNTALLLLTPLDQPHWLAYRQYKYHLPARLPVPLPPMEYAEAVQSLGVECGVAVCDVSTGSVLRAGDNREWSVDGIHLNAEGNQRVFEAIVAAIEQHWPELSVDRLPLDGEEQAE